MNVVLPPACLRLPGTRTILFFGRAFGDKQKNMRELLLEGTADRAVTTSTVAASVVMAMTTVTSALRRTTTTQDRCGTM